MPRGATICSCSAEFAAEVPARRLNLLHPAVRETVLELYDGYDAAQSTYQVPTKYDQAIPLISFVNHSDAPNCAYDESSNTIVAARPLARGAECTVDYFKYQERGSYTWRAAVTGFRRKPRFV